MAILFVDSSHMETKEVSLASFSALAVSARFPPSTFCWMDAYVGFVLFSSIKILAYQSKKLFHVKLQWYPDNFLLGGDRGRGDLTK